MTIKIMNLSERLGTLLVARNATVTTAESCTGGGVAGAITDVAGSSKWFHTGFITYANHSKHQILGVSGDLLASRGAVCEEVVIAMVEGAARTAKADFAVAISGIAGPTGGSAGKPIGTVWFAWLGPQGVKTKKHLLTGDRAMVRAQSIEISLQEMLHHIEECTTVHPYSK